MLICPLLEHVPTIVDNTVYSSYYQYMNPAPVIFLLGARLLQICAYGQQYCKTWLIKPTCTCICDQLYNN